MQGSILWNMHGQSPAREVQVSLAIRGGYVPEKFQTTNTKTDILGLIG